MGKIQELIDRQVKLLEELDQHEVKTSKIKEQIESISNQIAELKEQQDYGSFRFVHQNMQTILQKIAPKHKVPPPREINLEGNSSTPSMVASIPWSTEKCSDENPCNINVCPRCTLLHFKYVLGGLLASYYSK